MIKKKVEDWEYNKIFFTAVNNKLHEKETRTKYKSLTRLKSLNMCCYTGMPTFCPFTFFRSTFTSLSNLENQRYVQE